MKSSFQGKKLTVILGDKELFGYSRLFQAFPSHVDKLLGQGPSHTPFTVLLTT
jgi:hypothetical protein